MAALLNTGANLKTLFTASLTLLQIPIPLTAISIIFTYTRLMWWITPPGHRNIGTLWAPPMYHSLTIAGAQFVADIMGILGSAMIIKTPIPRLVSASSVLEMLVWLFLAILVFRFTLISRQWPMERSVRKGSQELGLALTLQAVLLASRGIYQVLQKDALLALQTTGRPISIVTTEEWPDYVFNILPTILILALQAVWHPGLYLPKRLMGFSLKRKQLLKDEATKGGGSPASNGWIISAPSPVTSEKMNGLEAKYMEILEAERKQYEPKYIGYAS
ncbi:hypothetical protein GQ53DRAFT_699471 [Thozetella sp. PMI_491]|nr:hypothetical protein GQ53DRAFT_699471 [Thozetella sp. PMI_491]